MEYDKNRKRQMTSPRYEEKETNDVTRWKDNKKRKGKMTSPGGTTIRKEREKPPHQVE